jgi:outer membrane autotransporter protein
MDKHRNNARTGGHRARRTAELAPIVRAVRAALAASAFVVVGTGPAIAGTCTAPDADNTVHCNGDFTDTITFPDADLTLVVGDGAPSSVTPATGDTAIEATWTGAISVTNDADLTTVDANGIEAHGDDTVEIVNNGTIATSVKTSGYSSPQTATKGIYATSSGDGGTVIRTSDDSSIAVAAVNTTYADTIGISAYATGSGDIFIDNAGDILSKGNADHTGIRAHTTADGSDIVVENSGDITAQGGFGGRGIQVIADGAGAAGTIRNLGDIETFGLFGGNGLAVASHGLAYVYNLGTIDAINGEGGVRGIQASSVEDDARVLNLGDIHASGGPQQYIHNYAIDVRSQTGHAVGENRGALSVSSGDAVGLNVVGAAGATAINGGAIDVGGKYGAGIRAVSSQGDASVVNSGTVTRTSFTYGSAYGITATAQGDVAIDNTGTVDVSIPDNGAGRNGVGVKTEAAQGDIAITNAGSITVASELLSPEPTAPSGIFVIGISAHAATGGATIVNGGDLAVSGQQALGISAEAAGDVTIVNGGSIDVRSNTSAAYAEAGAATGIVAVSSGDIAVTNSGTISATDVDHARAMYFNGPVATLNNSGTVTAVAPKEGRIAVQSRFGALTIDNTGKIYGAVFSDDRADTFANGDHGLWDPGNHLTNFGAGDDAITNAAGGTIRLADASIALGSGDNRFENSGTIKVEGDSSIDMGSGPDEGEAETLVPVATAVPSLNATPLLNNGVIDFLDGAPDDMLTITGDLGGSGALNLDMSMLNGTSDTLYVDGSIASGAAQTVNVALPAGTLTAAALGSAPIEFAQVSGDSTAGSFVGGSVVGYSPRDFLTLGVHITSNIDASNATNDTFSAQIAADGLNANGVLAASIAQGAQSLMSSQIGTWRQRMGVVPPPGSSKNGLSAWVRVFRDDGAIDPGHSARNFGDGGDFGFDQTNSGTEVGLNFEPTPGINLGVTLSKADGKQDLQTAGAGSDKIQANTIGLYGTWIAQNGFYVDASYRGMGFDAKLRTADNTQKVKGHAGAINLETGYAWELGNGLRLEPQFQYTWTTVDKVFQQGDQAYFRSDDSDWQRARVGLAIWKPIESGSGLVWTPYGALSAVRVWDGKVGYTINDAFYGSTDTSGTSALAELGLGLRKNGFSATVGANWTDGGALDSFVGGQVVLRYSW